MHCCYCYGSRCCCRRCRSLIHFFLHLLLLFAFLYALNWYLFNAVRIDSCSWIIFFKIFRHLILPLDSSARFIHLIAFTFLSVQLSKWLEDVRESNVRIMGRWWCFFSILTDINTFVEFRGSSTTFVSSLLSYLAIIIITYFSVVFMCLCVKKYFKQ